MPLHDRRSFLKSTAAIGVGYWVAGPRRVSAQESSNEKIQFACIGVGGKGRSDSLDAGLNGEVVAICDVDDRALLKAQASFPTAKKYYDFREMLTEMGDKIDAVTVSTPDHTHAAAAVMAMRMGKHCFCQKPLTHSIYEARVMGEVAREMGVITQMGNQGTAKDGVRKAAAFLRQGGLGEVKEVHVWTNRPVWPQGIGRPSGEPPVPPYLKWDPWIGPAPYRPYNEAYHPFKWRGFWDFGTGALGDMACHTVNMPFMGLNLRNPSSVEAVTSGHNRETYPSWSVITFDFPAHQGRAPLKFYWYDGGKRPDPSLLDGFSVTEMPISGALIIGDGGKLFSPDDYGETFELVGADELDVEIVRSPGHFKEFAEAIKNGEPAVSNFPDYAGPLTETILLGNLAVWSGKKVNWDAESLKPMGAPELESIVNRQYRDGYSLKLGAAAGVTS